MMNNTNLSDSFGHQFEEDYSIQPGLILNPLISMVYGYVFVNIYKKYKHKFEPVDILELNCVFVRGVNFLLHTHLNMSSVLPNEPWICFTLNFMLLLFTWSFDLDFIATQV